jgi:uncharacterized protein YjiS (DUF1127 family)
MTNFKIAPVMIRHSQTPCKFAQIQQSATMTANPPKSRAGRNMSQHPHQDPKTAGRAASADLARLQAKVLGQIGLTRDDVRRIAGTPPAPPRPEPDRRKYACTPASALIPHLVALTAPASTAEIARAAGMSLRMALRCLRWLEYRRVVRCVQVGVRGCHAHPTLWQFCENYRTKDVCLKPVRGGQTKKTLTDQ